MLSIKKVLAYIAIAALILLYYNLRLLSLSHAFDLKEAFGDTLMDGFKILPANRVVHVSRFGLGHRLIRDASAYHLAKSLDVARMKPQDSFGCTSSGPPYLQTCHQGIFRTLMSPSGFCICPPGTQNKDHRLAPSALRCIGTM